MMPIPGLPGPMGGIHMGLTPGMPPGGGMMGMPPAPMHPFHTAQMDVRQSIEYQAAYQVGTSALTRWVLALLLGGY